MRVRGVAGAVLRCCLTGAVLAGLLGVAACGGGRADGSVAPGATPGAVAVEPAGPTVLHPLKLYFEDAAKGGVLTKVANSGEAPVSVSVSSYHGGEVRAARAVYGSGARFPAFDRTDPAFAVLAVANAGQGDPLSPGHAEFSFGADVRMDAVTTGAPGDDGDNVVQRGLFEGAVQYKLQVDGGRVSCLVAGLAGEVIATSNRVLEPGTWYRLRCTRRDTFVRLEVARLADDGPVRWTTASRLGATGAVVMPRHTLLSVGGKLAEDGSVVPTSSDQLNGVVDRVFLRLFE